ncbi:MAG: O-antigen polysaccharide polymerase Wzy [Rhodothermales bacterium]
MMPGTAITDRSGDAEKLSLTLLLAGGEKEQSRSRIALLLHIVVVAVVLGSVSYALDVSLPPGDLVDFYCGLIVAVSAWMFATWLAIGRPLFEPYPMFVGIVLAFHAGFVPLRVFGVESSIYLLPDLSTRTLAASLLVVVLGLLFLHLGALVALAPSRSEYRDVGEHRAAWLRRVGLVLSLVALPATVLQMKEGMAAVALGGYRELFLTESSYGPFTVIRNIAADLQLTGAFFLLASSRGKRLIAAAALVLIVFESGYYLILGHRAYAALPLLATAWLWHKTIKPLPLFPMFVAGLLTSVAVFPLIGETRGLIGGFELSGLVASSGTGSLLNGARSLVAEAGGTLMTVGYTIDLVPASRPFELGATYVGAAANAIPMIHWPWPYGFGSDWLAWTVRPDWAANGFGFGYSFLAEGYLNFGWVGVPLVAAILGAVCIVMMRWSGKDEARLAAVATVLPTLLFYVRGESVDLIRPFLWRAVLPYLLVEALVRFARRTSLDGDVVRGSHGR